MTAPYDWRRGTYWRQGQVYAAAFTTFLVGLFIGIIVGVIIQAHHADKKTVETQTQNDALYGRIAELEGELADARREP